MSDCNGVCYGGTDGTVGFAESRFGAYFIRQWVDVWTGREGDRASEDPRLVEKEEIRSV